MDKKLSVVELPINTSPVADHNRQMLWQVLVPLLITALIVVGLMIWAVVGAYNESVLVTFWGNISAVLIIIPVLLVGILLLGIVGGMVYGMAKLLGAMPKWLLIARMRVNQLSLSIERMANAVVRPIFAVNTFTAEVEALWYRIFHPNTIHRP